MHITTVHTRQNGKLLHIYFPHPPAIYHYLTAISPFQENLLGPLSKRMNEDPDAMFNRLIKTDENFRFLNECLEWVREKLVRSSEIR